MTDAIASLVGAFVGAILFPLVQFFLEQRHRRDEQQAQALLSLRTEISTLLKTMLATIHAIVWLTWTARNIPAKITEETIQAFDAEVRGLFPELWGNLAVIAARDQEMYRRLRLHVLDISDLAAEVSRAGMRFLAERANPSPEPSSNDEPVVDATAEAISATKTPRLPDLYDKGYLFYSQLPDRLANILSQRSSKR